MPQVYQTQGTAASADGGHTWPGGTPLPWLGVTSTTINASALIGTFVATHPLH